MNDQLVNIKLVEEIQRHPMLYNPRHPEHSERKDAWNVVSKKVNMPVSQCKARWKNLRVVFARHMKPKKNGRPRKAYYLQEALQFAVPYMKIQTGTASQISKPPEQEEEDHVKFEEYELELSASSRQTTPSPSPSPPSPHSAPTINASQKLPQSLNITQTKRVSLNDRVENTFTEYSSQGAEPTSSSLEPADQDLKAEGLRMFLLSMLPDLLKMSDGQVRQFKRKALDAIDDILSTRPTDRSRQSFPCQYTTRSPAERHPEVIDEALFGV
ncbi:uncharacterized protein LOC129777611 [Toxorhynchites rutilus septentrionalis]|uniref:uncharacterized protein LOC129777611 n=1 Tax=Toxorhynchites rutilus septentrionalis TaxID=329112 RepID=UPI0024787885|nr:uncharacterized protein LOC129777611 [Toxorhynchites rutilus septentrionalis]